MRPRPRGEREQDGAAARTGPLLPTVIVLAVLTAGCATPPAPEVPPAPASRPLQLVAPVPVPPTPLPGRKPAVPARTAKPVEAPRKAVSVLPPPVPTVAVPRRFDPERLIGLSAEEVERLLGRPGTVDDVPPARIWRYAQGDCVLRIHLFMEMNTRSFRTLSYELNSTGVKPDVDDECRQWLDSQAAGAGGQGG